MSPPALRVLAVLLVLPALGRAEEAPPCRPGKPSDLGLVSAYPVGSASLRKEGGSVKARVTNRSGRVVCRLFGTLTLNGKGRPVTCPEPAVEVGAETEMLCLFTLLPGERGGGVQLPGARRPGMPVPHDKDDDKVRVRVKLQGLELADPTAYREWQARRREEQRRAAARAAAVRAGFRHTVKVSRASSPKEATKVLDRAMARLKECLVARAKRDPKLHVELQLRLGVSRAKSDDGAPENLLAVRVVGEKGSRPAIRDCVGALELTTLPSGLDFEAAGTVIYAAAPPAPGGTAR